jgi:hypothetical protein
MINYSPQLWSDLESLTRYYQQLGKNLKLRTGLDKTRFKQERQLVNTRMAGLELLELSHSGMLTREQVNHRLEKIFLDRRNGNA